MSKQIHKDDLVEFDHNEHAIALKIKTNKYYNLFSNTALFCKMLEETHFKNLEVDNEDFKTYIIDGKIFIGVDITDDFDFDDHHYLFDAFNVYYAVNSFGYYKVNKPLTTAWRKTLKTAYPNTSYGEDVKKMLKAELQEIVKKFNDDNVDLL